MTPDFSPKLQTFLQGIRGPNGRPLKWETSGTVRVYVSGRGSWPYGICPVCMQANIVLRPAAIADWYSSYATGANEAAHLGLTLSEIKLLMNAADVPDHPLRPAMLRHLGVA